MPDRDVPGRSRGGLLRVFQRGRRPLRPVRRARLRRAGPSARPARDEAGPRAGARPGRRPVRSLARAAGPVRATGQDRERTAAAPFAHDAGMAIALSPGPASMRMTALPQWVTCNGRRQQGTARGASRQTNGLRDTGSAAHCSATCAAHVAAFVPTIVLRLPAGAMSPRRLPANAPL
ncbi:hypothetical protein CBM2615_B100025 [Cupriavidus taiwanensis]|nr:hypothetical protein CBM2614_B100026 [Cupriavidus taiwanensis]SOZ62897.1 hypothetical protein CBM2615_B100025 [Cupriavidus taiwanensis]SPA10990.1 hypothetical protein CBM2625_B80026 [Cupriavidus taiwanensis]